MSRNKFNVNNRSARVSGANSFGANQQDTGTAKTLTTYLGLLYLFLLRNRVSLDGWLFLTSNLRYNIIKKCLRLGEREQ
jgi:hypothetical protein